MSLFIDTQFLLILLAGIFTALAASFLGVFVIVKRMALASDVLSHVALPGMGLALLLNYDPMLGAAAFLILAALAVWAIEKKTTLPPESIIGTFFVATLAIGVLLVPDEELLKSLFGDLFAVSFSDALLIIPLAAIILILTFIFSRRLTLSIVGPDLAESVKAKPDAAYLGFLVLFALNIALGIKLIGSLLMGALMILPAVAAKNFSWSMKSFFSISIIFGALIMAVGILVAKYFEFTPGPSVIITGIAFFIISLLFTKRQE